MSFVFKDFLASFLLFLYFPIQEISPHPGSFEPFRIHLLQTTPVTSVLSKSSNFAFNVCIVHSI